MMPRSVWPLRLLAHHIHHGDEGAQVRPRLAGHGAHGIVQRAAGLPCRVLQHLDRARPDAARREVHHAHEARVVVRVLQQAQVGQRMLDFRPLEKAQAAVHAVGHRGIEQRRLDHPALRVAAVEHGDLAPLEAVIARELADLVHHPLRFRQVGGRFIDAHRLARPLRGAQVLAQAAAVVADEGRWPNRGCCCSCGSSAPA